MQRNKTTQVFGLTRPLLYKRFIWHS